MADDQPQTPGQRLSGLAVGLVIAAMLAGIGAVVALCALDVIATPPEDFGAPRWVVGLVGAVFLAAGAVVFCSMAAALLRSPWLRACATWAGTAAGVVLVASLLVAGTAFLLLKLVDPSGAGGVVAVAGIPLPLPEGARNVVARVVIAFCLACLALMAVLAVWAAVQHVMARLRHR